jgi:hypothetical protein
MYTSLHFALVVLLFLAIGNFASPSVAFDNIKTIALRHELSLFVETTQAGRAFDKLAAARTVRLLIEEGADPHVSDYMLENGSSALHFAVQWDDPILVQWLLDRGCCLTTRNNKHCCPVFYVPSFNAKVMPLLDHNYKKNRELMRYSRVIKLEEIETVTEITETLINLKKLIKEGADPCFDAYAEPCIILLYAIKHEDYELLDLVAQSPYFEPNYCRRCLSAHRCRISYVLKCQHPNMVHNFIHFGVSIEHAFQIAVQHKNVLLMRELVSKGASINFCELSKISSILDGFDNDGEDTANELVRLGAFADKKLFSPPLMKARRNIAIKFQNLLKQEASLIKDISDGNFVALEEKLAPLVFNDENILFAAARLRHEKLLCYLLEQFRIEGKLYTINKPNHDGLSLVRLLYNINDENLRNNYFLRLYAGPFWMLLGDESTALSLPLEIWQTIFIILSEILEKDYQQLPRV